MGYICNNYGIYSEKLRGILRKNNGKYWAMTIGYNMGYIEQIYVIYLEKGWDIFGKKLLNILG